MQPSRLPRPHEVKTKQTLGVLIDTSASMGQAASAEAGAQTTRLDQVRSWMKTHQVTTRVQKVADAAVYAFDGSPRPVAADALSQLEPVGKRTDLAAAVAQTENLLRPRHLAAILLFTDGRHTQGADPRQAVSQLRTPLYFVPVGQAAKASNADEDGPSQDVSIVSVSGPPRIVLGRASQVVATIAAEGFAARQVTVEMAQGQRTLASSAVAISPQQPTRQALFTVRPTTVGKHQYEFRTPPIEGETDTANNQASFELEVVDPVNRLVYIDRLRHERRFLKAVIAAQRNLRYTAVAQQDENRVLLQSNDQVQSGDMSQLLGPEQFGRLKAVMIGDVPAAALTDDQIAALADWVDSGGALMLLAGPQSFGANGFAATRMGEILPVQQGVSTYLEAQYTIELTPQGAAHPAFQNVDRAWSDAPPLLSRFEAPPVRPAATVLLATGDKHRPLVISHRYGHGKVAIVLTNSTWRWQLAHRPTAPDELSYHRLFWQHMIDWLLPDLKDDAGMSANVQLVTDRINYEVNDPVTLMVNVRDHNGQFIADADVEIRISAPDGRSIERTGAAQQAAGDEGDGESLFLAAFDAYAEGDYDITASARAGGRAVGSDRVTIHVTQPLIELAQTDPDLPLLEDMAKITGGRVLRPDELGRIVELAKLRPRKVLVQPNAEKDAQPVWDRWWILALFVALAAGEWLVRRKNQWV